VSLDTAFCIHAPQEQISKNAWLSHYSLEGKDCLALFFYATGAYHANGKNECIRKMAYGMDLPYMVLAHADPIPPKFLVAARASGADLVFCGKHVWMDTQKVARLAPPWFGPDWATSYDYLKKNAAEAGLKVAELELDPWAEISEKSFEITLRPATPDTVDILIPCSWDFIPLRFWSSLATMRTGNVSRILICGEDDVVEARNALVEAHLKGEAGHSIFFDADMSFPPDTINRLLSHGKDIIGGAYYQRQFPYYPHLYDNLGTWEYPRSKRIIALQPLMEVASQGTGCLLVRREVYEKIGSPWYSLRYVLIDHLVGEDINFALTAKRCGFTSYADTTLDIGHIGAFHVTPAEAAKYRESWRPL
jgi:hypothetical protein